MSCPADEEISALLDGSLSPHEVVALEAHLADCADCADLVGHVGALGAAAPTIVGGRYRVESLLGRGGMGEVWAAFDPELERRVAIKLIRAQLGDSGSRRLVREARALARLQDPNVVAVYDVGESDGEMFVVTELVDGETLQTWQKGRENPEVIDAYLQAASGLAAAHREGLVHRDVKPTNLFVGKSGRVKVGDFGLAISAGTLNARPPDARGFATASRATEAGRVAGTPAYMAPEQRGGAEADARADQFSLTTSLVEAIGGHRPSADASGSELVSCGRLAPILARSLARAPADRYPDMTAWADAIAAAIAEAEAPASQPRRGWVAVTVAMIAAAVALSIVVVTRDRGTRQPTTPAPTDKRAEPAAALAAPIDAAAIPVAAATIDAAPVRSAPRVAIKKRQPPASPPPHRASSPPAPDAIDAADRALRRGDGAACLAALGSPGALSGPDQKRAVLIHARCEMLAGNCAGGSERLRDATRDDKLVTAEATAHCRTDRGDIATRVRRLYTQVSMFAMHRRFGCRHYEKPALAAARHVGLGEVPRGKSEIASVLNNLAECHAKANRCDRATALLSAGRAQKLPVMPAISACSP